MYRGIDVSSHNGMVDYGTAQAAGLDFVMIRCGYGSDRSDQDDSMYLRNVQACQERDIPWGAYLYSYAMTLEEAQSELTHMLRLLNGKRPRMPIAIDMEDADGYKAARGGIDRQLATDIVRHVCAGLESAGYYAMWYCNRDWCQNHLYPEQLAAYDLCGMRAPACRRPTAPVASGRTRSDPPAAAGRAPTRQVVAATPMWPTKITRPSSPPKG